MGRRVRVAVQVGDIAKLDADVIALKYPNGLFGVAGMVAKALGITDEALGRELSSPGSLYVAPGNLRIGARQAAFLRVVPLSSFGYPEIRQFAFDVLRGLRAKAAATRHLGLTLHGVMFGMNLHESLRAELAGCAAAVEAGECPRALDRITIVSLDPDQVRSLQSVLREVLPDGVIAGGATLEALHAGEGADHVGSGFGFDVFISYKSEDARYAQQVFEYLRSHARTVFFSRESLPRMGSDEYHAQIDLAIEKARHMVLVTSSASHAMAQWVQYEWRLFLGEKLAGRKDGNLITVIADDMRIADLPIGLRNREVVACVPEDLPRLLGYTNPEARGQAQRPGAPAAALVPVGDFVVAAQDVLHNTSWPQARERGASLSIDGQDGWRLPTLEELRLVRQASVVAATPCYWSAQEAGTGEALYMHFDDGHVGRGPKSFSKGLCAVFVRSRDMP
ncbi:MAG: TIR domain-containing protein [Acidobacteriota bacterium]